MPQPSFKMWWSDRRYTSTIAMYGIFFFLQNEIAKISSCWKCFWHLMPTEFCRLLQRSTRKKPCRRFQVGFLLIPNVCSTASKKASKFRFILLFLVVIPSTRHTERFWVLAQGQALPPPCQPPWCFLAPAQRNLKPTRSFELTQRRHSPGRAGTLEFLQVKV